MGVKLNSVIGITMKDTAVVDCDNVDLKKLINFSKWITKKFRMEGFIILKSSKKNYHVVFNKAVSFMQAMRIASYYAICLNNAAIGKWTCMQMIKRSATLRISNKGRKKAPKVIYRYGKTDNKIAEFLLFRRMLLKRIRYCCRS